MKKVFKQVIALLFTFFLVTNVSALTDKGKEEYLNNLPTGSWIIGSKVIDLNNPWIEDNYWEAIKTIPIGKGNNHILYKRSIGWSNIYTVNTPLTMAEVLAKVQDNWYTNTDAGGFTLVNGTLTISKPGTYTNEMIGTNTVTNLVISSEIANNEVIIKDITVTGTTTVNGGGSNSVIFIGCTLNILNADKTMALTDQILNIKFDTNTKVAQVLISKEATITIGQAEVNQIIARAMTHIESFGNSLGANNLSVETVEMVYVNTPVESVLANINGANVTLSENAKNTVVFANEGFTAKVVINNVETALASNEGIITTNNGTQDITNKVIKVKTVAELQAALLDATNKTIFVEGTLNTPTIYNVINTVTIKGINMPTIYGSFNIKANNVIIDGIKLIETTNNHSAITITGNTTPISGFELKNSTLEGFLNGLAGQNANSPLEAAKVTNNLFKTISSKGVYLEYIKNGIIFTGNTFDGTGTSGDGKDGVGSKRSSAAIDLNLVGQTANATTPSGLVVIDNNKFINCGDIKGSTSGAIKIKQRGGERETEADFATFATTVSLELKNNTFTNCNRGLVIGTANGGATGILSTDVIGLSFSGNKEFSYYNFALDKTDTGTIIKENVTLTDEETATSEIKLLAALKSSRVKTIYLDKTFTVNTEINDSLVGGLKTLIVNKNVTITFNQNMTLSLTKINSLINNGTINGTGIIKGAGVLTNNGSMIIKVDASLMEESKGSGMIQLPTRGSTNYVVAENGNLGVQNGTGGSINYTWDSTIGLLTLTPNTGNIIPYVTTPGAYGSKPGNWVGFRLNMPVGITKLGTRTRQVFSNVECTLNPETKKVISTKDTSSWDYSNPTGWAFYQYGEYDFGKTTMYKLSYLIGEDRFFEVIKIKLNFDNADLAPAITKP
ncbi:MAG: hypothetical protein RSE91_02995 [Bacilli bacterium]